MARGTQEPPSWIEVPLVIEAIHRMLGPGLETKRIEVRRESAGEIPRVFLRRGDLEQILLNLVYNARDAMPAGGSLFLRSRAEDGGVVIEVEDTGEGMTAEVRQRVFEPFFTTKRAGSGLGLDICRSIVWDCDGRIDLDSEPKRGTRVRIWLPRLAERLRAQAGTEGENESGTGPGASERTETGADPGTGAGVGAGGDD
jgi:signal transduction histidine kinase